MNEIECVRQNSTQDEYLKKLFLRAHLPTRFLSWEDSKISTNSPLVLVVDEDSIEALTEICEFRDLKVIIALNTRKEFKLVSKLTNQFEKIFGFIDLSQELDYNTPILLNYINLNL